MHRFAVACFRTAVVATMFAASQTAAAEPPKVSQRWAVLVGVDEYAYAQKLQYCGADQRALRDQLVKSGFPTDHIFLLHDKAEDPKFRPSQRNIERQLNLVLNLAEREDLVVVGFSGHGVHLDGKSFLCPGDCTLDDPATLIGVDHVYDRLKDCAAGFKLVVVDACRNDPRPGGSRSMGATAGTRSLGRSLEELKLPEGVVLLNSCDPGEISWEDEQFGHGVFMHYVLEGLNGAADVNNDRHVSLMEMQSYAGTRTKTFVANRFSVTQRPFFKGDLSVEALEYALLATPQAAKKSTPDLPDTVEYRAAALAYNDGDMAKAEAGYRRVIEMKPPSRLAAHAWYGQAWIRLGRGEVAGAAEAVDELFRQAGLSADLTAKGHFVRGVVRYRQKNYPPAMEDLDVYLKTNLSPRERADGLFHLGLCYAAVGKNDEAVAAFTQALDVPDYSGAPKVLYEIGWLEKSRNRADAATAAFTRLANEYPNDSLAVEGLFHVGEAAYGKKNYDSATAAYSRVREKGGPELAEKAAHKLGWAYFHSGNFTIGLRDDGLVKF